MVMHARTIAKALGGRKAGAGWMARCPAHDDHEPSLSITPGEDGKVLLRFGKRNRTGRGREPEHRRR